MFDQFGPHGGAHRQLGGGLVWIGILAVLAGILLAGPQLPALVTSRLQSPGTPSTADRLPDPSPVPVSAGPQPSPQTLPVFWEIDAEAETQPSPTGSPAATGAAPTRIVIDDIGLDAPVVSTTWETVSADGSEQAIWLVPATRAAGWHEGSALLGLAGNTVLNGHNTTHGEVFRDLYLLEPGTSIVVYSDETPFHYAIQEVLILPEAGQPLDVRIANGRYIQPTEDERLTLVTCHPYGSLQNRLVVIALPAESGTRSAAE